MSQQLKLTSSLRCMVCNQISVILKDNYQCTQCNATWDYSPYTFNLIKAKEIFCPTCHKPNGSHRNIGTVKYNGEHFLGCSICRKKFRYAEYQEALMSVCINPYLVNICPCGLRVNRINNGEYDSVACKCRNRWIEIRHSKTEKIKVTVKCLSCTSRFSVENYDNKKPNLPFLKNDIHNTCSGCWRHILVKWVGKYHGPCPCCKAVFPIYKHMFAENSYECLKCGNIWGSTKDHYNKSHFQRIVSRIEDVTYKSSTIYKHSSSNNFKTTYKDAYLEDVSDDMTNCTIHFR